MKTKLLTFFLVLACSAGFYSCGDDEDEEVRKTEIVLTMTNPDDLTDFVLDKWIVTFTEKNTNSQYTAESESGTLTITVPEGNYKIVGESSFTCSFDGTTTNGVLDFVEESKVVVGASVNMVVSPFYTIEDSEETRDFVIQEIFYTGTATPEGKAYDGDNYIVLYNNTSRTLYADGLFLATTQRNTSNTNTFDPEIKDTHVPVNGIIIIPGTGKQYPVEPGKSFILTESAINHKTLNDNSFDLSIADMEWRNDHLLLQPANNPNVPDANLIYNFFSLHTNGLSSIIMGRLEVSPEQFLADYVYEHKWTMIFNGVEYVRGPFVDYKIPNEWVLDAVYTSVEGKALASVFAPSIDRDWTYCGAYFGDKDRYGKSVIRKVLFTTADDRNVLKDTNNSAVDFTPNATPSLAK